MADQRISLTQLAWKSVSRKIIRNFVLILAVSGLVCLLVFAGLFKKTVTDDIELAAKRLGADIVIVPAEAQDSAEEFILESKEKTFYMDDFLSQVLAKREWVEKMNTHIYLETLDAGCCSIDEGQVIVFDSSNDFVVSPWISDGSSKSLGKGEILVGNYVYEYLGLMDTTALFGRELKVMGHLKETGTGLDHGIFLDRASFSDISPEVLSNYKQGTISIIFLKLKEGYDVRDVVAEIRSIDPLVGIMTRGSIGSDVRSTLADIERIFTITILIAAILSVLLAWSTFTAIANERRREVGILRAIGARKTHIVKMFLIEASIIALLGGVVGVCLGHLLVFNLGSDFHLFNRLGAESTFSTSGILVSSISLCIGAVVCLIGASIPILKIANLEPLSAIQQE